MGDALNVIRLPRDLPESRFRGALRVEPLARVAAGPAGPVDAAADDDPKRSHEV